MKLGGSCWPEKKGKKERFHPEEIVAVPERLREIAAPLCSSPAEKAIFRIRLFRPSNFSHSSTNNEPAVYNGVKTARLFRTNLLEWRRS